MKAKCALALLVMAAPAMAEPSFDCAKAATDVEKALCLPENQNAAYRDMVLADLYKAMKEQGGFDAVLSGQSAWLKSRNACGGDAGCLIQSYDRRIAELARAAGDETGITGTYSYETKYDPEETGMEPFSDVGEAFVVRDTAGLLNGYISTVSGPTFHSCELEFSDAEVIGNAWLFTDSEENADFEGRLCRVLVRQENKSLRIDSIGCSTWCGARGYFDNSYERAE